MSNLLAAAKPPSGVLNIDKAPGMTSHDVVALVRRALREAGWGKQVKVGHAGTLDPDATGVLLVCLGGATRLADLLAAQGKVYQAEFRIGVITSTEDASGEITGECDASRVSQAEVEAALVTLTGAIEQIPPMVSAVHHEGRRLYELARQGIEVERAARTIIVDKIDLLRYHGGVPHPTGEIIVECGKGTYVRTLCADLGARLGVGGHMSALRRLRVGVFEAENGLRVAEISAATITGRLVGASDAVSFLPQYQLSDSELADVLHGRAVASAAAGWGAAGWVRLVDSDGELIALAAPDDDGRLRPKKVLAGADI